MLTTPLRTDGVCLFPSTCLFVRVSSGAVEIVTTEGAMRMETDHPRFLLRDLQEGKITEARPGMHIGRAPFDYAIHTAVLGRRRTTIPAGSILPENVSLPKGTVLFETSAFSDYHDFASVQIIGIKRNGHVVVGLADTSYELTFAPELDVRRIYRDALERDLLTNQGGHFTAVAQSDYLPWFPAKRIHCQEIAEIHNRPESWGSTVEILSDLRAEPSHAKSRTRIPPEGPPKGMDI